MLKRPLVDLRAVLGGRGVTTGEASIDEDADAEVCPEPFPMLSLVYAVSSMGLRVNDIGLCELRCKNLVGCVSWPADIETEGLFFNS